MLTFPVKKAEKRTKKELEEEYNNYLIVVNPKRCISLDQMRLTHVLLKQYGDELGYTLDEIKNVLKDEFTENIDFVAVTQKKVTAQGNSTEYKDYLNLSYAATFLFYAFLYTRLLLK